MSETTFVGISVALIGAVATIVAAYITAHQKDKIFKETLSLQNKEFNKFLEVGMESIHPFLSDDNIQKRLKGSREIKILKTWFPENVQIEEGLLQAIGEGAKIELLLCKPDSQLLRERCKGAHEEDCHTWIYRAIKKTYESMISTGNKNVKIILYDSWPGCPVIWLDNGKEILMGFYFRGKSSPKFPWIKVKAKSELAKILDDQFSEIEKLSNNTYLDSVGQMEAWLDQNKRWEKSKANYSELDGE